MDESTTVDVLRPPNLREATVVPDSAGDATYHRLATFAVQVLSRGLRLRWGGGERVPRTGGVLVVANHTSNFDPVALGHFLLSQRRYPRYLGKSELWRVPVIGYLARACRQIPVQRGTAAAGGAVDAAVDAIRAGELVVIYPEGTITADPDGWPMTARPGAARIALATGCLVVPVASWGAQDVMGGKKMTFPRVLPRKRVSVLAGEPVRLDDLVGSQDKVDVNAATERIMTAVTGLVETLRGESAPAGRYDMRVARRVLPEERA